MVQTETLLEKPKDRGTTSRTTSIMREQWPGKMAEYNSCCSNQSFSGLITSPFKDYQIFQKQLISCASSKYHNHFPTLVTHPTNRQTQPLRTNPTDEQTNTMHDRSRPTDKRTNPMPYRSHPTDEQTNTMYNKIQTTEKQTNPTPYRSHPTDEQTNTMHHKNQTTEKQTNPILNIILLKKKNPMANITC